MQVGRCGLVLSSLELRAAATRRGAEADAGGAAGEAAMSGLRALLYLAFHANDGVSLP